MKLNISTFCSQFILIQDKIENEISYLLVLVGCDSGELSLREGEGVHTLRWQ